MLRHAIAEEGFANFEPIPETMHTTDLSEFGGFVFEGKRRITRKKFVFGTHDLWQVRFGNDTVIVYGFGRETASIRGGQTCEISDDQVQSFVSSSNRSAAVVSAPFTSDVENDGAQFIGSW
jgi:hypothetical protein